MDERGEKKINLHSPRRPNIPGDGRKILYPDGRTFTARAFDTWIKMREPDRIKQGALNNDDGIVEEAVKNFINDIPDNK